MADQVDQAQELTELAFSKSLQTARQPIPTGTPGECRQCGEDMPRLVAGRCGYCRDGRRRS